MDHDLFLSGFQTRFEVKNQRHVAYNFPVYGSGTSFATWHCRVVSYCASWGIFVPPLQTLRDNNPYGVWFKSLRPWVREAAVNVFDGFLATCFKNKSVGLLHDPLLARIVLQSESGYQTLYALAEQSGHPLLQTYPRVLTEPQQRDDCCLADHILHWLDYVQEQALRGTHLSDRYFLQQFCRSMHSLLEPLASYLESAARDTPVGVALPHSFSPHRLLSKLMQRASHKRYPKLITESPRAYQGSQQAVRALMNDDTSAEAFYLAALGADGAPCMLPVCVYKSSCS